MDEPGIAEYRRNALAKLNLASSEFSQYVAKECAYQASLAVKGNGAEDIRLACVAVLSQARANLITTLHAIP